MAKGKSRQIMEEETQEIIGLWENAPTTMTYPHYIGEKNWKAGYCQVLWGWRNWCTPCGHIIWCYHYEEQSDGTCQRTVRLSSSASGYLSPEKFSNKSLKGH